MPSICNSTVPGANCVTVSCSLQSAFTTALFGPRMVVSSLSTDAKMSPVSAFVANVPLVVPAVEPPAIVANSKAVISSHVCSTWSSVHVRYSVLPTVRAVHPQNRQMSSNASNIL